MLYQLLVDVIQCSSNSQENKFEYLFAHITGNLT